MFTYLINVSITWIILFVLYKTLLEKEKYFTLNRAYLISSLVLGLLLPLISYIPMSETAALPTITSQISEVYQSQIIAMDAYVLPSTPTSTPITLQSSSHNWILILQLIYFLGLTFAIFRLIKSSSKLFRLVTKSQIIKKSSHSEIVVNENILPFSFMKYIFIGNQDYNSDERNNILSHELFHVQAHHSIDILFVELFKLILWWHPMVYLYKKSIAENHEYAADQAVLAQSSRKQYCQLLIKTTFSGINLELTNPFFQTFIKKRITMMYQKESKKLNLLKYPISILVVLFIAALFIKPLTAQTKQPIKIASVTGLEPEKAKAKDHIDPETVTVTAVTTGKKLNEGEDFKMDRKTGKIRITNDEILRSKTPVKVSFEDKTKKEGDKHITIEHPPVPQRPSGHADMGAQNTSCKISEKGIYYNLELTSRLPSCPEGENGRWHAYPILGDFAKSNFNWPKEAIEAGFTKFVVFNVVADEKGNLTEMLEMHDEPYPYGIQEEGHRIIDLMRKEFKFLPGECDGVPVKTGVVFGMKLEIPEDKRHLVKVKDGSNVVPGQVATLGSASSDGKIYVSYKSNMNVAFQIELEDPNGKIIFKDSKDHIYSLYGKSVHVPKKLNGWYLLRVKQDGHTAETLMNVMVFK